MQGPSPGERPTTEDTLGKMSALKTRRERPESREEPVDALCVSGGTNP
jgi:hypothetical protein